MKDEIKKIPQAISSSVIRPKKGIEITLYHLDNGQSVVATEDMEKFCKALIAGELSVEVIKSIANVINNVISHK